MWSFLFSLAVFLITISLVIGVHEWGHFWVARRFGILVKRFSIGFGKAVWCRRATDGVEYVIAAIPLGGYVKFLDPQEEAIPQNLQSRTFQNQPVWKRACVVAAGPLVNLLLAFLLYWLIFVAGIEDIRAWIDRVVPETPAAAAGVLPQSEIIAVDGIPMTGWLSVRTALLRRLGDHGVLTLTLQNKDAKRITEHQLSLKDWKLDPIKPQLLESFGITPLLPHFPFRIGRVVPDLPAARAGVQVGDEIVAVNQRPIHSWLDLHTALKQQPDKALVLQVKRDKQLITFSITPQISASSWFAKKQPAIGIASAFIEWPPAWLHKIQYPVLQAAFPAFQKTAEMTALNFQIIKKMLMGQVSVRNLSGVLAIMEGASTSIQLSWKEYALFIALLSVGLGVLNLLPIPLLDGGQLVYFLVEAIRGKPLSPQVGLWGIRLGGFLLVGLMLIALYNDVLRLWG